MIKINKDIHFVLVYNYMKLKNFFAVPNSTLILESLLKKNGVMSNQILIYSFKKLIKEREIEKLFSRTKKKKYIFLISIFLPPFFADESLFYHYFWRNFWQGITKIKRQSDSLIIVGGPGVTVDPIFFMKDKMIDVIALGEAEKFIPNLLKIINKKGRISLAGAYALEDGKYVFGGKRKPLCPLGIYRSQKMILRERSKASGYLKRNKPLSLEFSRGCLFDCSFCGTQFIRKNCKLRPKEWFREIQPRSAANLIATALIGGFRSISIIDNSFMSHSVNWLKIFLKNIEKYFPQAQFSKNNKPFLIFSSTLSELLKIESINFIKEMTKFFIINLHVGVEAIDRETLLKFNKPWEGERSIKKDIRALSPLIKSRKIIFGPSIILINPWTNFKKLKRIIKFCNQWASVSMFPIFFGPPFFFMLRIGRGSKIRETIYRDNLLSEKGLKEIKFKFAYAKKPYFPKDESDTDINRFYIFLKKTQKIQGLRTFWGKFFDRLKRVNRNTKEIEGGVHNDFFQFYIRIIDEAEKEWPMLSYNDYEGVCEQRVKELERIMKNSLNKIKNL